MVSINQLTYEQVALGTSTSLIYLCPKLQNWFVYASFWNTGTLFLTN